MRLRLRADPAPASEPLGELGGESLIGCGVDDGVTCTDRLLLLPALVTGCVELGVGVPRAAANSAAADDDAVAAAAAEAIVTLAVAADEMLAAAAAAFGVCAS